MTKETKLERQNKIVKGLEKAYEKMVEFKKKNNSPLIVSRNGKIIAIPPDEILPTTSAKNEYAN